MERLDLLHEQFCQHAFSVKGNSKTTVRHHRAAVRSFFAFCDPVIQNLKLDTIEAWAVHMHVVKNNAPKTRSERFKSIRMLCKWLGIFRRSRPMNSVGSPSWPTLNRIWWPLCTEIRNRPWMRRILINEEVVLINLGVTLN